MSVSNRFLLDQGPMLATLARVAVSSLRKPALGGVPSAPGPWVEVELPPRPDALVSAYVRHVGGDAGAYRKTLPVHLFPQWAMPVAAKTLEGVPYQMVKVLNAGCSVTVNGPLPRGEALVVRARLESVDDDGRRAILTQRVITGTRSSPDALVTDIRAYVPLEGAKGGAKKEHRGVPLDAREIGSLRLGADAGMDFARLTGDLNPIHWLAPYARAFGYKRPILHGFATLARAIEVLQRGRFAGDVTRLRSVDARFNRPLMLPARVNVYLVGADRLAVADAPGAAPYLDAVFGTTEPGALAVAG